MFDASDETDVIGVKVGTGTLALDVLSKSHEAHDLRIPLEPVGRLHVRVFFTKTGE